MVDQPGIPVYANAGFAAAAAARDSCWLCWPCPGVRGRWLVPVRITWQKRLKKKKILLLALGREAISTCRHNKK